ncbi:MAG: tellurite resistance TerB family protein, partial [Muribaculaceae bacterium]|nr:tellurite resistance TerB family protein [Muribaculaceae bacterium]
MPPRLGKASRKLKIMGFFDKFSAEINAIFNEDDDEIKINDFTASTPPPLVPPQVTPCGGSPFSPMLERLINAALADGVITDKERQVLHRKAQEEGVDPDELDLVLEAMLYERKRDIAAATSAIPTPPPTP